MKNKSVFLQLFGEEVDNVEFDENGNITVDSVEVLS